MSEWIVYSKDGITEKCTIKSLEYSGSWMGECYITATIKSATPLSFSIGDYLEYRGERFEINYDPSVIKSATSGTYGEGFTYDNVKFNSLSDELTRCDFLDYVPEDNLIHYSSLPNFSFFADTIDKLAERIQVNLDRVYTGEKKWTIEVYPEYVNKTNVNIVVNNMTCWDALALVKSQFNANFVIKNRTITIGTEGIAVDNIFSYGKGNGLVTIERNAETDQKIVTRLRAYGSTRNLPMRYYFNNGEGIVPNNMAVQNLMLPSFPKETLDPYVDSENISELGIREATIFFDGSGEFEEIYPSMEGMTAEDLISAGIQVSATGRLDEVVGAEQITDNGIFEPTEEEPEINIPTFTITLKDVGFDINDHLSAAGSATISMKDGMCGGREFEIVECKKEGNNYILTCNRAEDTSLGSYFPYNDYNIKAGDKFVLLNIEMPDVYIQAASQRLLTAAKEYLAKNDYVRYSYTPKVDNIYMARQHDTATSNGQKSIHDTIKEGDLMLFEDNDLLIEGSVIIDTLSIKEGEGIPEYEITLRNDKAVGTIEKIQNQIDSIVSGSTAVGGSGGYNASQIKSLIKTFGSTFFLRKDQSDTAKEVITFEKGLNVGEFVTGASGASFFKDLTTGQTIMELDKLYVRMKAFFETLTIVEAQTISGKQIISPAGSVRCTNVEEYDGYYRCYFLNEQDGEKIENKFIVGDQVYSQMFNAKTGTSNKISNRYYWRLVTGVGENYIDLSKTDCDADSDAPMVGDILNQRGHRYPENSERMNFIETSTVDGFSPSITLFHGVNSFSLSGKDYIDFGVDKTTNKAIMYVYGDMYVGDRNKTSYMRYTQEEGLVICGKLDVGTKLGDSYLKDLISASTPEGYQEFVEKVTQDLEGLQAQIDGTIDSYFFQYEPSLDNYPASEWDTESEKQAHLNDTFTNLVDGRSWRWAVADGVYTWVEITDTATTKALALAGKANDTADGKRRVFIVTDEHPTPYPPYDKGDLWSRGSNYPLMICVVPKAGGAYEEGDFDYADNNAKLKDEMKTLVTDTKDELNNSIGQATEAANTYTDNAKLSLQQSINELNESKANIDDVYTQAQADGKISEAEQSAIDAAKKQADAAIALSETTIKAYADGIVDDEEAARIKQAQENLAEAKEYAEEQAQAAKSEIENSYLFQALQDAQSTEIANGLVLTSLIQLRDTQSNIMSGINGLINASKGDKSIATWWGGDMLDLIDYYRWDGTQWVVKSGLTAPSNIPSGLIRMDGTGYLAKGKFWWDNDGKIYADPTALFLSFDVNAEEGTLSATILDIRDKQTEFANMWTEKTDSNGTKYLYTTYPLVTQGGVTMYAGTSGLDVEGIYDGLPIDGKTIYWENGLLKAVGGGGVADSVAWADITGKPTFATVATSGSYNDLLNKPTLLSSFTNDLGFVTESALSGKYLPITGGTLTGDLGLAYNSSNNSSKGIRFQKDGSSHLYLYRNESDLYFDGGGAYYKILRSDNYTSYTYSQSTIDSKLSGYLPLTGGTLSGELYFGREFSLVYARYSSTDYSNILYARTTGVLLFGSPKWSKLVLESSNDCVYRKTNGTEYKIWDAGNLTKLSQLTNDSGFITSSASISGNAATATKLATARTIWGQSFDGSGNIDGTLTIKSGGIIKAKDGNGNARNILELSSTNTLYLGFDSAGAGGPTYLLGNYIAFRYGTSKTEGMRLNSDGNVGIGTTAPNYKLHVNGSLNATTIYQNGSSLNSLLNAKLNSSSYTASDVLAKLKTVDGSGSGLDADTLDGYNASYGNNKPWDTIPIITAGGYMDVGKHFEFHYDNTTGSDYSTALICTGNHSNMVNLPSQSGTLALLTDNVASATKLQTARTIWGQSFDGSGNVSGDLNGVGRIIRTEPTAVDMDLAGNFIFKNLESVAENYWHIDTADGTLIFVVHNNGNVGIGTTRPAYKLDVNGTIRFASKTIWGQSFDGTGNVSGVLTLGTSYITGNDGADILNSKGQWCYLGAGTSEKGFPTYIDGHTIHIRYGTTHTEGVRISSSGHVGIGTTNPEYKLDVNGAAMVGHNVDDGILLRFNMDRPWHFIQSGTGASSALCLQSTFDSKYFHIRNYDGSNVISFKAESTGHIVHVNRNLYVNERVGIGTTSPSHKLHVEGSIYSSSYVKTSSYVQVGSSYYDNGSIELYGGVPFIDFHYNNSTADFTSRLIEGLSGQLTCTGKFRIGLNYTTSTDYNFYVSGSAYISSNLLTGGGITMYSARVLKNVIDEDGLSLRELSVIKPTRYTWKDKRDERLHIGGIADDIQQVLPEVVYRTPDGILTMDYGNAAFAIASSLIQPVISHEERIARLERENRALKEEVKRLKSA